MDKVQIAFQCFESVCIGVTTTYLFLVIKEYLKQKNIKTDRRKIIMATKLRKEFTDMKEFNDYINENCREYRIQIDECYFIPEKNRYAIIYRLYLKVW